MSKESSDSWIPWVLKAIAILFLAALPAAGILGLFLLFPWISQQFSGPAILLSGLTFLIGAAIFISSKNVRYWLYSIVTGYAVGFGGIVLGVLEILTHIAVPVFGNAFNITLIVVAVVVFTVGWFWPLHKDSSTGSVGVDPILSSSKSIGQGQILGGKLFDRKEEKVFAVGLVEIPHGYVFSEKEKQALLDINECSHTIARTLTGIPFGWTIQRVQGNFRVVYFTFSRDEMTIERCRTRLLDALRNNLKGFSFDPLSSYSGPQLREDEVGSAAIITGVPLSIKDEEQKHDPLEAMVGVLQGIENGMFQVFIEPYEMKKSNIRSLQNEYRKEVERSETTISKEKSGWLGTHQESKTTVNHESKKQADILERKLKRLTNPNLHKVTVTTLSWGRTIEDVDHFTRRITSALVGALRPDNIEDEFKVTFKRKRKDIVRLLKGLPVGDSSILTSDEVATYLIPPRRDVTVRVTKREKFSSGTRAPSLNTEQSDVPERVTSQVPSKVQWILRTPEIHLGNPIDESGKVLSNKYVLFGTNQMNMHLGVFGNTQSGKTTSVINLTGQAITLGINPVVLIPSKSYEWWVLMLMFPEIRIFTCGRSDIANLVINIWNPPKNVQISKWVDRVVEVWTLWFPNDQVISMHIEDVIYTVYKSCGWNLRANTKGRPILLEDLVDAAREVSEKLDYGDEVKSNLYGALVARIKSILRKPALVDMLNTPTGLTIEELLAHPTIIDLDSLSGNDKILLIGILVAAISEYKLANPTNNVTNLLVLEEAHYLLGRTDNVGEANSGVRLQAINAFIEMLRTVGGTGLGVVLIDQSPTSLVPQAIKIVVNLIIHALSDDDQTLMGKHARCTDSQTEHIGGMAVGEAVVYLQQEGAPKNVKMFQIGKYIQDAIPKGNVNITTVIEHMQKIFSDHPELEDSKPLPEDILERLKIRKKSKKGDTLEISEEEKRSQALEKAMAEFSHTIERIVSTPEFGDYCNKCITEEKPRALVKLIKTVSRKHGKGDYVSNIFVLKVTVDYYLTDENYHIFEETAKILDGERIP